jgi:RNA polymerase sigma factor (sigma-70 family)
MKEDLYKQERDHWRALSRGDENALEWLFDNFSQGLFNYGMKIFSDREVVKDCIQDLFSDLWKNRSRLIVPDSPKIYLFKALKYKIFRLVSQDQKKNAMYETLHESDVQSSAESIMIDEQTAMENRMAIKNALSKLTQRQREVLVLRYFEDMNHDEIAALLKINKQSVYNLLYSALASLKEAMLLEINLLSLLVTGILAISAGLISHG